MWLEEKLHAAVNEKPDVACLYCDTAAAWEKRYAVIILCERMPGDDLPDFLESTGSFCDKFIVAGDASTGGTDHVKLQEHPKLLAYLEVVHPEDRRNVLWQAAALLNTEWVCFMTTNERFVPMYPGSASRPRASGPGPPWPRATGRRRCPGLREGSAEGLWYLLPGRLAPPRKGRPAGTEVIEVRICVKISFPV